MSWYTGVLSPEGKRLEVALKDINNWWRWSKYEMWIENRDPMIFEFDIRNSPVWEPSLGVSEHSNHDSPYALWMASGFFFFYIRDVAEYPGTNAFDEPRIHLNIIDKLILYYVGKSRIRLEKTKTTQAFRILRGNVWPR